MSGEPTIINLNEIPEGEFRANQDIINDPLLWGRIAQAREDFLKRGVDPLSFDFLRPIIAHSWITSKNNGVDPATTEISSQVSLEEYQNALEVNGDLINTAGPLLRYIESLDFPTDYIFELVTINGITLMQKGGLRIHHYIGTNVKFDERVMGTNAHAICMRIKKPFMVFGPEHFCDMLQDYIAFGAPILNRDGKVLGALLLTCRLSDEALSPLNKNKIFRAMSVVASLSKAVETQLQLTDINARGLDPYETASQVESRLDAQRMLPTGIFDALNEIRLVIDQNHTIRYSNPEAAQAFRTSQGELAGRCLFNIVDGVDRDEIIESIEARIPLNVYIEGKLFNMKSAPTNTRGADGSLTGYILTFVKDEESGEIGDGVGGDSPEAISFESIMGVSPQLSRAIDLGIRFSKGRENILISGETGTGKELFARAIHNRSRKDGPFISVNCAAVPPQFIEYELFGYEAGAFPDSEIEGRPGRFEMANGGTLFLDEVGDMPLDIQATLLRVLDDKCIMRVGGDTYRQIDFRLIASTNQNLFDLVDEGRFREDLLYRLSVLTINLPPLRARTGDAPYYARLFLDECERKMGNGKAELSPDAMDFISTYSWPGNVRQLKHAIYSAYYTCENGIIEKSDLPQYLKQSKQVGRAQSRKTDKSTDDDSTSTQSGQTKKAPSAGAFSNPSVLPTLDLGQLEELAIAEALKQTNGNVISAARILGISKATLYRKLKTK